MDNALSFPLPWYVAGPLMGLIIASLYLLTNNHLGVSGAYVQVIDYLRGRKIESWRLWFLGGTFAGAAIVSLWDEYPQRGLSYGALGDYLTLPQLVLVLLIGGMLIGFGARWAGGCTSGHGLSGCSTRSSGSMVALITFVTTAVGVTFLVHWITGGAI